MIKSVLVRRNECTCFCGHTWLSDDIPKRCAGCRSRNWNSGEDKTVPIEEEVKRIVSIPVPVSELETELDPFSETPTVSQNDKPQKPKSSGSKIAEDLLAKMASKLGRPAHALNCTCYTCKPPKLK